MTTALIAGSVFTILGFAALVVGVSRLRMWRQITSTETSSIRDAAVADGIVEVTGTAQSAVEESLTSPMTQRDCVAFEYTLKRAEGTDTHFIDSGSRTQPFLIDDGTGTAYVDPDGAELSVSLERINNVSLDQLPEYISTNPTLQGTRRYKEGHIETDGEAYVIGSPTTTNRSDSDTQFTGDDGMLLISNQDAAGTAKRLFRRGALLSPIGLVGCLTGIGIFLFEFVL